MLAHKKLAHKKSVVPNATAALGFALFTRNYFSSARALFSVDRVLGIYSVCLPAFFLATGYFLSLSRYLSFIFPMWINVKVKNKPIVAAYIILCFVLTLVLWSEFLNDRWVG